MKSVAGVMLNYITAAEVPPLVDVVRWHSSAVVNAAPVEPTYMASTDVTAAEATSSDMASAKSTATHVAATEATTTHVAATKSAAHMAATHVTTTAAMTATTTVAIAVNERLTDERNMKAAPLGSKRKRRRKKAISKLLAVIVTCGHRLAI